ncbi:hypothetical protein GCM10023184_00170 [Flaviaesturariibacter amylovorans]|uniref:Uncharacterized protein n=1 Tax=Flaviaesturariibacter amylovorans TaxID=1084520 RepID=A0ABP8G3W7_9BACT
MDQLTSEDLQYYRSLDWIFKVWQPSPALIEKKAGNARPFVGQSFDPAYFDLVQDGWTHDHCEICFVNLSDDTEAGETDGYTADRQWICKTCHAKLFPPSDGQAS